MNILNHSKLILAVSAAVENDKLLNCSNTDTTSCTGTAHYQSHSDNDQFAYKQSRSTGDALMLLIT